MMVHTGEDLVRIQAANVGEAKQIVQEQHPGLTLLDGVALTSQESGLLTFFATGVLERQSGDEPMPETSGISPLNIWQVLQLAEQLLAARCSHDKPIYLVDETNLDPDDQAEGESQTFLHHTLAATLRCLRRALRWNEEVEEGVFLIPYILVMVPGEERRAIPLQEATVEQLNALLEKQGWICIGSMSERDCDRWCNGRVNYPVLGAAWAQIEYIIQRQRMGALDLSWYTMRALQAFLAADQKTPIGYVSVTIEDSGDNAARAHAVAQSLPGFMLDTSRVPVEGYWDTAEEKPIDPAAPKAQGRDQDEVVDTLTFFGTAAEPIDHELVVAVELQSEVPLPAA